MKAGTRRSSMINMDASLSSFSENFYKLFSNFNEDTEESLVSLLEEKVIPKNERDEKLKETQKRPKTLMVDKQYENRRSFHRNSKNNDSELVDPFFKTYEYYESLHSPAVARRRASSITVPHSNVDLSNFLQVDRIPRSISPRQTNAVKCVCTSTNQQRNRTSSMPVVSNPKQKKENLFSEMAIVSTFSKIFKLCIIFVQLTRFTQYSNIIKMLTMIDESLHKNELSDKNTWYTIKNREFKTFLGISISSLTLVIITFLYMEYSIVENFSNKILVLINVKNFRIALANIIISHKRIREEPMLSQTKRPEDTDEYYRLRSFSITPSGVCKNLGDCLKTRRSRSSCSVDSSPAVMNQQLTQRENAGSINDNSDVNDVPIFTVGMLGAPYVGKSTLSYQFTASEYISAYDLSLDDEYGQKTVSIALNGEEAQFNIIDIPSSEMSVETFCSTFNVDVFVVVYSISDAHSFSTAREILLYLWKHNYMSTKGVILVGNKMDLERLREVPSSAGRKLALTWRCKFIETSSGIDHHINELLVGIFTQVQLNPIRAKIQHKGPVVNGKQLLKQIFKFGRKTKSCENLFVL